MVQILPVPPPHHPPLCKKDLRPYPPPKKNKTQTATPPKPVSPIEVIREETDKRKEEGEVM